MALATSALVAPDAGVATLELRKLDKRFAGTHALKAVSLSFMPGEVHAIVGENGAGKSTLIKLLTGVYPKTSGTILWQGREVEFSGPQDALALGINAVHPEVVLCPHLTVAANIFLGDETTRFGLLRKREMTRRAQDILDELGFHLPADATLSDLTIGQQQLVATARAASRGTRFLVFDEPTGYLTRAETDQLFALIHRLHEQGVTIIYISHRMEEIFQIADRVSVLRDGQLIGTHIVAETNERDLIREMVNRPLDEVHHKEVIPLGETLLEVKGLSGPGFEDVSLTVRRGEIVGLYGLIGAGRSEFVHCLFGRTHKNAGEVKLKGKPVDFRRESDAIDNGIVLLPESRRDQGLCLNLPVGFNLNLPVFHKISVGGLIRSGEEKSRSDKQMRDLRIVAASRSVDALTLSGGNQQKIVIGKWLNHGADLFIFDEPTVGVDVGTKAEIYKLMAILLRNGAGIILISSYLPEVYDLSDTLHVFRKGRLAATFGHRKVDHETILAEAIGT
jgi:ribose transport system ATP-binding protein